MSKHLTHKSLMSPRRVVYLLLMFLLLYAIVPRLNIFVLSYDRLRDLSLFWIGVSVAWLCASYVISAAVYYVLLRGRLYFGRTVLVQIAAAFWNRLLPAGSGAIGVNYLYLRRQQFSSAQSVAAVALNNFLGFIGHVVLFVAVTLLFPETHYVFHGVRLAVWQLVVVAAVLMALVLTVTFMQKVRRPLLHTLIDVWQNLARYRHRPFTLLKTVGLLMGLTLSYVACLYAAALASGVDITLPQAFIVLTASVTAATVIPTPGGLGGAEAGIIAGLVAYDVAANDALVVALLYRLVTFWLPLLWGTVAFVIVERRGYLAGWRR